eukprot:GHVO01044082.1.p1 GENE.GHVO01044082.1~~GHVO01044082.1.p1  ORF type:complete len:114 (+),score=16.74 GHVO01044082.1:24-344(+)
MAESSGGVPLKMPSRNDELRRAEEATMHGADLKVRLMLPHGGVEVMQVKASTEVGYVKLLLSEKLNVPSPKIKLMFEERTLIDPMSFCDFPGIEPPQVDVHVLINE